MHPRPSLGNLRLTNTQRGTTPAVQPTLNLSLNRVELSSVYYSRSSVRLSFLRSLGHIAVLHHSLTRLAWVCFAASAPHKYSTCINQANPPDTPHPHHLPSPHLTSLPWLSPRLPRSSNARQNPLPHQQETPRDYYFPSCPLANQPRKIKIP
jgi:hypothetical protein